MLRHDPAGRRPIAAALVVIVLVSLCFAVIPRGPVVRAESASGQKSEEREAVAALFDALRADVARRLETHRRGERWRSGDSGILAWSCGQQLSALVDLYLGTGERQWLDQLVEYADAMFANLTPNRGGFVSRRSRLYSRVHMRVEPDQANRSAATVEPAELWIDQTAWVRRLMGQQLTAAKPTKAAWLYELVWRGRREFELKRPDGASEPVKPDKKSGRFEPLPLVELRLRGRPAPGDRFTLTVELPKDFDCAVHDGVILTPICRFIQLVRTDAALRAAYGKQAHRYLKIIERDLVPKWDRYWRYWHDGGLLVAQTDEAFAHPGIALPHNQYLALGNVLVLLHRITGKKRYRQRAENMARFFQILPARCRRPLRMELLGRHRPMGRPLGQAGGEAAGRYRARQPGYQLRDRSR